MTTWLKSKEYHIILIFYYYYFRWQNYKETMTQKWIRTILYSYIFQKVKVSVFTNRTFVPLWIFWLLYLVDLDSLNEMDHDALQVQGQHHLLDIWNCLKYFRIKNDFYGRGWKCSKISSKKHKILNYIFCNDHRLTTITKEFGK